jgi:uncharacterized membrane protein
MSPSFHFRKTWRPGPFRITLTEKLRPTWGIRAGRYGYDPKTGRHSFDTPGLGWIRTSGRARPRHSTKGRGTSGGSVQRSGGGGGGGGGLLGILQVVVILGALAYVVLSGWPL